METQMRMTVVLSTNVLLLIIICGYSLRSVTSSNAFYKLADSRHYHYGSIFSPLFKALSEHGASRWSPDLKKTMKPDYKYMKYMTELYKKSSRVERSLDGSNLYNTVRLIRPQDECIHRSKEFYMQDLSYNLERVRDKEQLLRSVLLYWYDDEGRAPSRTSTCYLNIKEQGYFNQCPLCPGSQHTVNFTMHSHRGTQKRWLEIDVTPCFEPLLKFQKSKLHVLINLTCTGDDRARGEGNKDPVNVVSLRSPPLLLYLNDTSKVAHQRLVVPSRAGPRPPTAADSFDRHMRPTRDLRLSRRRRRDLSRGKRGGQSLDIQLPELRSSSEFPTSDCALYDFKVKFSQLKLDHWIVFPPKYNPRFCRGTCPRTIGFIYGSPVHTMVQNIIYEKLDSSVPRPSCIPSHYSPLSVMMFEEDGSYVYKEFEDMVATSCTCR